MTPEERTAHCRRIASAGGKATLAKHGTEHFSAIGKKGFEATMLAIGGHQLWKILRQSYQAKYGDGAMPKRNLTSEEYRARQRVRYAARKLYPDLTCDVCGEKAQHHHVNGCHVPNANDDVVGLCQAHHIEVEISIRKNLRQERRQQAAS